MQDGIAVVSFDCNKLRLLPKCHVDGDYSFRKTSGQRRLIRLRNLDEIKAHLPSSGARLGTELEASIKRGATLDISLQTIGRVLSSRSGISRELLRGECEDATHIVRGATLGAFTMNTNTSGQVNGNVAVVSGEGSSEKSVRVSGGDMEACNNEDSDGKAPAGCNTPIRLHLEKIEGEEEKTVISNREEEKLRSDSVLSLGNSEMIKKMHEENSYSSKHPLSLNLRGFYRTGKADGYKHPSLNGAMVVGEYKLSDNFAVHGGVGVTGLRNRSLIGNHKTGDPDTVFTAMAGASVLMGSRSWPVAPVAELNFTVQGHGVGGEIGLGAEVLLESPFNLRVLGTYGVYDTGQVPSTNPDGKPTPAFKLGAVGGLLQVGGTL